MHLYVKLNYYTWPYSFCLSFFGLKISLSETRRWQQLHTPQTASPSSPAAAPLAAGGCTQHQEPWPGPTPCTDRVLQQCHQV